MLEVLLIFVDDDFGHPLYADPALDEIEPDLWHELCECVNDALEGDGDAVGAREWEHYTIGWRTLLKSGVSFVAVGSDVSRRNVEQYLKDLCARYLDEVDNVRKPEREGVADVVVDVIPDWDDDDD